MKILIICAVVATMTVGCLGGQALAWCTDGTVRCWCECELKQSGGTVYQKKEMGKITVDTKHTNWWGGPCIPTDGTGSTRDKCKNKYCSDCKNHCKSKAGYQGSHMSIDEWDDITIVDTSRRKCN